MRTINRQAILLRKKQPFADWLTQTSQTHDGPKYRQTFTVEDINRECKIYLLEEIEVMGATYEYVESLKPELFEAELAGWYNSSASHLWPQDRSNEVFDEWFDIEYHSMVMDLEKRSLKKAKHEYGP